VDDKGIHNTRCNHPSDQENQTQEISNSPHDPESYAQPIQTSVEAPPDEWHVGCLPERHLCCESGRHELHDSTYEYLSA